MKRSIFVCLILFLIIPLAVEAGKKSFGNGLYWKLSGDGTLTISGKGDMPALERNCPWERKHDKIKRVVIKEGVTSIGRYAFGTYGINYKIQSITIANSVKTIGLGAFSHCYDLTSIEIPNSIVTIGDEAFSGCYNLSSVVIPNSVIIIGKEAFKGCNSLTSITIPSSVTAIGKEAFSGCDKLLSVDISAHIKRLDNWTFSHCKKLSSVKLPNSIEDIGSCAFGDCISLESIIIPSSVKIIGIYAFADCTSLSSVVIPNSVEEIYIYAFSNCTSLSSIVIPNSVKVINSYAFQGCKRLSSIEIPNSVKQIGEGAFANCNLNQLIIPQSVSKIGDFAFAKELKEREPSQEPELIKPFDGRILQFPLKMRRKDPNKMGISTESFHNFFNKVFSASGEIIYAAKEGETIKEIINHFGHTFYTVEGNGTIGMMDKDANWIVRKGKYSNIELIKNTSYIKVKSKEGYGIITRHGEEIISPSRGYTWIGEYDKGTFPFSKKGYSGVCDSDGREVSLIKIPPTPDEIKTNGGYASIAEMRNGSTLYYKVSRGGRYGLTDSDGNVIIPLEMSALESAGAGYLKYQINGFWGLMNFSGKIIIDTNRGYTSIGDFVTFTKRFPYTMNGYKGECDATGKEQSRISVKPKQNNQASQKTTLPSERKADVYNDVRAFDLKGNVKSCEVRECNVIDALKLLGGDQTAIIGSKKAEYNFLSNGKYIPNGGEKVIYENNILKKIVSSSDKTEYVYENNRLCYKYCELDFFGLPAMSIYSYTYDRDGMMINEEFTSNAGGFDKTYSDYKLDSKGNWIFRKCEKDDGLPWAELRIIKYY